MGKKIVRITSNRKEAQKEAMQINASLRDIKIKYIRFKTLTERQIEAFKETVKKMKEA